MDVIRADRFHSQLKQLEPNGQRAECLVEGPIWVLTRKPDSGTKIRDLDVWYILSRDVPKSRELIIWYTFTDDTVTLLSITVATEDDDMP